MPQSSIPLNYKVIGQMLKAAREMHGLTVRDVEEKTGCVSYATINKAENFPSKIQVGVFIVLFKFYGLDPFEELIVPGIEPLDWPEDGERSAA